jgi:GDP-mannose transporter
MKIRCVASTSATTYAIVGTLNKVPIAFLGIILFKAYLTKQGYFFVAVNFIGCACYSYCKMTEQPKKSVLVKEGSGAEVKDKDRSDEMPPQFMPRRNKSASMA